jgi:Flp pilus assembly protein TadD
VGALVPFFVLGIAFGLWTAWLERYRVGAVGPDFEWTLLERCLIAGRALWFYAAKLVWPYPLIFIYARWTIDAGIWWQYLFPAAAAAGVGALWLARKRWGRGPLVAVLFFAGTLVPALGFFNVYPHIYSFVADHFQYLASIGVIALLVGAGFGGAGRLGRRGLRAAVVVSAALLATLGTLTWRQAHVYGDLELLWRHVLSRNPGAWIAHNNLGTVLLAGGRIDESIGHFREALTIAPQYPNAHVNLCGALRTQGRVDEAIDSCRQALRIQGDDAKALNNLGAALLDRGDVDEAIRTLRRALELRPNFARAHSNLGVGLRFRGEQDLALDHFRRAVALLPDAAELRANLGVALLDRGAIRPAADHLRRALELDPGHAAAHHALGRARIMTGQIDEGLTHLREAVRLKPDWPVALNDAAWVLATFEAHRQPDEAIRLAERANELTDDPAANMLDTLAVAYAAAGRFEQAMVVGQAALERAAAGGDPRLEQEIAGRLELYRRGEAYAEAPP